jgi:hypothetical protein
MDDIQWWRLKIDPKDRELTNALIVAYGWLGNHEGEDTEDVRVVRQLLTALRALEHSSLRKRDILRGVVENYKRVIQAMQPVVDAAMREHGFTRIGGINHL